MTDVRILLYKGGSDVVGRTIMDVTGSPYAHTAIYLAGFTFDSTVWMLPDSKPWMIWSYRSGWRITIGVLEPYDLALAFRVELTPEQVAKGLEKAIAMVNSRSWYNFALTVVDALLFPTRKFWGWLYRKTGWAPFAGPSTNCSYGVDLIAKAMGVDLWPGMPESLTVPGDYPGCSALVQA